MILQRRRQHVDESIHLDMQEGLGGDCLQRPGDRAFAGAADAIKQDDFGRHVAPYRLRTTIQAPPTLCSFWQMTLAAARSSTPILTA